LFRVLRVEKSTEDWKGRWNLLRTFKVGILPMQEAR
jgi:hypothetical protein